MLDLRLVDRDRNRRILIDRVDPIVLTKNMQSQSYGLKEAARCDFDGMFCAGSVETRYFASSKIHAVILPFRFYFAITLFHFCFDRAGGDGVEVVAVIIYLPL